MQFFGRQHHFSSNSFNENSTAVMYEDSMTHGGCASAVRSNYTGPFLHGVSIK